VPTPLNPTADRGTFIYNIEVQKIILIRDFKFDKKIFRLTLGPVALSFKQDATTIAVVKWKAGRMEISKWSLQVVSTSRATPWKLSKFWYLEYSSKIWKVLKNIFRFKDLEAGEWTYGPELPIPVFRSAMAGDDDVRWTKVLCFTGTFILKSRLS
jgi:hypothetical protein